MTVYKGEIGIHTCAGKPDYHDITERVAAIVSESGVKEGICSIISCHTTCSIFIEEYDHDRMPAGNTFLQQDLNDGLQRVFPEQHDWSTYRYPGTLHFEEVESWPNLESWLPGGDRTMLWNGDAHLRSTILGSSVTMEVGDGKLQTNGLPSVFFVDFDRTRERNRRVRVVVIGE